MVRNVSVLVSAMLVMALIPAHASAQASGGSFTAGAAGIGDAYFPLDGNGGYDAVHYDLRLTYAPPDPRLTGVATIRARATQNLSSFHLDLIGMTVDSVRVDGHRATWVRDGQELIITPERGLREGRRFTVEVRYQGVPQPFEDGTGSGWLATDDGALVIGQPHGATTWFPANDHPSDKATYTVRITVPQGVEAISNGRLRGEYTRDGWTTWKWSMRRPMASYLATATIGDFDLTQYREDGVQYLDALDPDLFTPVASPTTGESLAFSGASDGSYKRLVRTIAVPAGGGRLSFQVNRQTEPDWDHFFVEAHTPGSEDWTTLPDLNGHTSGATGKSCPSWLSLHPFLSHYQSDDGAGGCSATGSSGSWQAASGRSDGVESWNVDVSAWAGRTVEIALSYASDTEVQQPGVFLDDIEVSTGEGSTSFEDDGDTYDGWTVAGPPPGSPGNADDWAALSGDELPSLGGTAQDTFAKLPGILAFESELFGRYPFRDAGGIVDDVAGLGFALENQTRPIYALDFFNSPVAADSVVVHEAAHQWFGNSVSVQRWQDIWLNEGFATYAEWLRLEEQGARTAAESFARFFGGIPADNAFWTVTIGDPGPERLLDIAVYWRGAMTLQVLRETVGDEAFFATLRTWVCENAYGNATVEEFIALAERVAGRDLDALFQTWLFTGSKPVAEGSASAAAASPVPVLVPTDVRLPSAGPRK